MARGKPAPPCHVPLLPRARGSIRPCFIGEKGAPSCTRWHVVEMEEERRDRTSAVAIFTLPLRAGLLFAGKIRCTLPAQLEYAWSAQMHVARSGLCPFVLGFFFPGNFLLLPIIEALSNTLREHHLLWWYWCRMGHF